MNLFFQTFKVEHFDPYVQEKMLSMVSVDLSFDDVRYDHGFHGSSDFVRTTKNTFLQHMKINI